MPHTHLEEIPVEIYEAAGKLHNYFSKNGKSGWQLGNVADRKLVEELELKITKARGKADALREERDVLSRIMRGLTKPVLTLPDPPAKPIACTYTRAELIELARAWMRNHHSVDTPQLAKEWLEKFGLLTEFICDHFTQP